MLSGCNSEPSEQDIYTAMNKVVEQTNAFVKSIAGKDVPKDYDSDSGVDRTWDTGDKWSRRIRQDTRCNRKTVILFPWQRR
ncbi:hypothetical protein ACUOFC_27505 [Escherichia sp. TWPC-MK]